MSIRIVFPILILAMVVVRPAIAIDLFSDTKPQSTGKTCQSYAAALALAAKGDPSFPIETFSQLRDVEQEFRKLASKTVDGKKRNPYDHQNWVLAMSELTSGKYTFERSYNKTNIVDWLAAVNIATTIDSDIDLLLARISGTSFDVALTSVWSLEDSSYSTGHIITVLGVIGSGIDSNTEIVAFNSAIKGEQVDGVMCTPDTLPGDERYSAGVVTTNNYVLKGFPKESTNYLFMRLVEK